MPLFIDAYNLLHVTGVLPPELAGPDLEGLIALIQRSRYRHLPTTLFCDGTPPSGPGIGTAHIRMRFSGPGRTADELMISAIRRSNVPRRVVAVSSDREIQREARRRRCRVIAAAEFMTHLAADASGVSRPAENPQPGRPTHPLSSEEAREWIAAFDLTRQDLALRSNEPQPPPSLPPPPAMPPTGSESPIPESSESGLPDEILRQADELAATDDRPSADSTDPPPLASSPSDPPNAPSTATPWRLHNPAADEPLFPSDVIDDADRLASDEET